MTFERRFPPTVIGAPAAGNDLVKDHRARLAAALEESNRKRMLEAAEQVAENNGPIERIRAWERIHDVRLPTIPTHPLVRIIAARTNLSVAEVQEEQKRRISLGERATRSGASLSWNSSPIR